MKLVLTSLLQGLLGWFLVAAGLSGLLQWQYEAQAVDTIGVSLFVGGLLWAAFWLVVSALGRWREMRLIGSGGASSAPADGKQVVLFGVIEATGPALRAPLDRAPCVAYHYEVKMDRGSGKQRTIVTIARGTALTPCHIRTRSGTYRLRVVPDLEAVHSAAPLAQRIENFLAYAEVTTFTEGRDSAKELLAGWSDDDGSYRSDVRFIPTAGANTVHWLANQQHVPPGAQVCVFGRYSKAQGGIVPTGLKPVRLVCGDSAHVVTSLRSKVRTRSVIALGLGASACLLLASFISDLG